MAILWQFGSYNYTTEGCTIEAAPESLVGRPRIAEAVGWPGGRSEGGLRGVQRRTLRGVLKDVADLAGAWDDFRAAHEPGSPQALYLGRDDRYVLAEVESLLEDPASYLGATRFEVGFVLADPYTYAATASGSTTNLGTTGATLSNAGKQPSWPTLTIPITAPGTGLITVTNTTTGESFTLDPTAAETLTLDHAAKTCVNGSGTDRSGLVSGTLFSLRPGSNVLTIALGSGVTITNSGMVWRSRW